MKKIIFLVITLTLMLSACSKDELAPTIEGVSNIEFTIGETEPDLTSGISAIDDVDGDLTESLVFDISAVNFSIPGVYTVYVSVSDVSGNQTETSFDVTVTQEAVAPIISGTNNLTFERGESNIDLMDGVTASDNVDGEITQMISVDDSEVDYDVPGIYEVTYSVSDAAGNETTVTIEVEITGKTDLELIMEDVAYYTNNQMINSDRLNLLPRGGVNGSTIVWSLDHDNVLSSGIILQLEKDDDEQLVEYTGTFKLGSTTYTETFTFLLEPFTGVELVETRTLPFVNLTTEYDVADGELDLYYELNGEVPYVNIEDFLNLIEGFIDPQYDITFTLTDTTLTLYYEYYDEEEDYTYELEVIMDSIADTIVTNDPGFYWAYVSTTETNFGRHINYVEMADEHYLEGSDVVYELSKYRMDIAMTEDGLLIPFYIANQLFAGSSYYNVYYNFDGLYGIYSIPDFGTDEFSQIRTSSVNQTTLPTDLVIHNYDMLAFSLDYFYGLRDYLGIDSFYELMERRSNKLLSHSVTTVDLEIRELLLRDIDEPHTSYGIGSYYNRPTYEGPPTNSLSYYGERFNDWYMDGLVAIDDALEAKWGNTGTGWAAYSDSRPYFWFLDDAKTSVVLSLDSFSTSDIEESTIYDGIILKDMLEIEDVSFIPVFDFGSKYFYYNNSTEENRIVEILIKGSSQNDLQAFTVALDAAGYTYVLETSEDDAKDKGYYTYVYNETQYMIQVEYNDMFDVMAISIVDETPETYEDEWITILDAESLILSDSAVYLEEVLENIINEAPNLSNIMLDVTWNTGGNVGALYRVLGFITSDPFMVSRISGDTGSASSSYVQIDGVPTYSQYNWALLVSKVSFSAANSLATIFKYNDLGTIIGVTTGGGASSITPVLLPIGTSFTMSSTSVSAYRTGSGTEEDPYQYFDVEYGITPDIEISIDLIYDPETLLLAFE